MIILILNMSIRIMDSVLHLLMNKYMAWINNYLHAHPAYYTLFNFIGTDYHFILRHLTSVSNWTTGLVIPHSTELSDVYWKLLQSMSWYLSS